MSTTTIATDKQPRKQLSDQLDRLDAILDALSDGLNGAVADAVREGTQLAVKDAVVEMMTDPILRARLHQATAPEPEAEPERPPQQRGFWARVKSKAAAALQSLGRVAANVAGSALRGMKAIAATAANVVRSSGSLGRLTKITAAGLGAGVAVAVARYVSPPAIAAAWSGVRSVVTTAAANLGVWTRQVVRALSLI
jgi:hypothetical protein